MVFNPGIFFNFIIENDLRISRFFVYVILICNNSDTHQIIRERNIPKPTFLRQVSNSCRAFVQARVTFCASVISPDRHFFEILVIDSPTIPYNRQAIPPTGIYGHFCFELLHFAFGILRLHTANLAIFPQEVFYFHGFDNFSALFASIVEKHQIKLTANYLPGCGSIMIEMLEEVKWRRHFAIGIDKLNAEFFSEMGLFHLVD